MIKMLKKRGRNRSHLDYFNDQACLPELIVVLHGIKSTPHSMRNMNAFFNAAGYSVIAPNLDYDHNDIEETVTQIHEKIGPELGRYKRVHFVGYSLGGMALRAYLNDHKPANIGRAVQLGSPNQGSLIMRLFMKIPGVKWLAGPMAVQISKIKKTIRERFFPDNIDYDLGVIAGDGIRGIRDFFNALVLPGGDDGIVSFKETAFSGMKDHVIIDENHLGLRSSPKAALLCLQFIKQGNFTPLDQVADQKLKFMKPGFFSFMRPFAKGDIDRLLLPTRWFIKDQRKNIKAMLTDKTPF